jgi:anti-sigma factor RsiW
MTHTDDGEDRAETACPDFIGLIVRAADGTLGAADRGRLGEHLAACAACREALESQQLASAALAAAADIGPPLGFASRIVANLDARGSWLDRLDFRRWTWRVGPVAAGLCLVAYVVVATGETAAAADGDVVVATGAAIEPAAVLWSDAMNGTDLVSLIWEAEVAEASVPGEAPQ